MTRRPRTPFTFLLAALFLAATGAAPIFSQGLLVDLDAANLPAGPIRNWANAGALKGWFSAAAGIPVAGPIAGRRAVTFTGKNDFLKSSFPAPAAITGGRPFTFAAWVLDARLGAKKVIGAWAPFPSRTAEVGIGRARNAAFFHSASEKLGYEGGVPENGIWHHIAVTYDRKTVRAYLDGALNAGKTGVLDIQAGEPIFLGAGWDARKRAPASPFDGSLARVWIFDRALAAREVRNLAGFDGAFAPSPKSGENVEGRTLFLRWENGSAETASFDVYIASRRVDIESADPGSSAFMGRVAAEKPSYGPIRPTLGETYWWRVDEVGKDGRVLRLGSVWSFRASPSPAREPSPRNGIAGVKIRLPELRWTPGAFAVGQDVTFGDSLEEVKSASAPTVTGLAAGTKGVLPPRPLEYGTTYYWRVDTDNGDVPPAPGEIWWFRTEDLPVANDVTFFVASDLHYGASVTVARANAAAIDLMNSLAGTLNPITLSGVVRMPRGVVLLGDLVDDGNAPDAAETWNSFAADYGLDGEGRIVYPVYEGVGNHDGDPGRPVRRSVEARNRRRPGVRNISADGLHYSWDWDQVHCVQLNLFPGAAGDDVTNPWGGKFQGEWKFPRHSLEFLIDDLVRNVGTSGRPVVLFQHYGWDEWSRGWWSDGEREAYAAALKGYNVAAIFWGHSHVPQRIDWNGIPTFCVGSANRDPLSAEFFVVRITPGEMTVAERTRDGWGLTSAIKLR